VRPAAGHGPGGAQHEIGLAHVLFDIGPGTVVGLTLGAQHQVGRAEACASQRHATQVTMLTEGKLGAGHAHFIDQGEACRTSGSEVADIREIRALPIVQLLDHFGDQEIEVGVALAMSVADQVDRHPVDEGGEVGAVIEIEAAQEKLVGLARAGMLRRHQPGHVLEQVAAAQSWT
jgi:hypothetical protein